MTRPATFANLTLHNSTVVFKRNIHTAQANRSCDDALCSSDIRAGEDYTIYELGYPGTRKWARRRRHFTCTPTDKAIAFAQLVRDLEARRLAGDFD